MSIPPRKINDARLGGRLYPLAIYGEGVADRPGVRSHCPNMPQTNPICVHVKKNLGCQILLIIQRFAVKLCP